MSIAPPITGSFRTDRSTFCDYFVSEEARIVSIGEPDGSVSEVIRRARDVRARFTDMYGSQIYRTLTDDLRLRLRLDLLLERVGDFFPELLPSSSNASEDPADGSHPLGPPEIYQSLLVRAFLNCKLEGEHLIESMLQPTEVAVQLINEFRLKGNIDLPTVSVERRANVGYVTLRNVTNLNAEDNALGRDLEVAIDLVLLDPQIAVGVIRGAEMMHKKYAGRRVLSAGMNLRLLRAGRISFVEFLLGRELGTLNKLRRGLFRDHVATYAELVENTSWIGVIDSFAIGGGLQLMLCCDYLIAEKEAFLSLPASNEGLVPGTANLRLARFVGQSKSRELIRTGRRLTVNDSEFVQICDEVAGIGELDQAIDEAVIMLSSPSVAANTKMCRFSEVSTDQFRDYVAEFALVQAIRMTSVDVVGVQR